MSSENSENGMITLILYTAMQIYKYKRKYRLTNWISDRETLYNYVDSSLKTYKNIAEKSYNYMYIQIKKLLMKMCIGL